MRSVVRWDALFNIKEYYVAENWYKYMNLLVKMFKIFSLPYLFLSNNFSNFVWKVIYN